MNKIEMAISAAGFFFFIAVAALLPSSRHRRRLTAVVSSPSSRRRRLAAAVSLPTMAFNILLKKKHLCPQSQYSKAILPEIRGWLTR